ncbi:hypothetical protein B0H13DRAFT_2045627 [Mycena leptocephala]|nr:hypothetical protein B0H13DRAFT_2045627 [Mycena leptocephala]
MARFDIAFLGFLSFLLVPMLLMRYYPDSAEVAMAVAAWIWVIDTYTSGVTAFCLCIAIAMSSMLVCDSLQWLTRPRGASPIALEDGTAVPPTPTTANTETDAATPAMSVKAALILKLICFISCTSFVVGNIFFKDVVSLDRPVLENLAPAALYILRGFEVMFAAILVLMFVVWHKKRRSDAAATELEAAVGAPATPVEVLFDDGVVDEKDLLKAEDVVSHIWPTLCLSFPQRTRVRM